MSTLHLIHSVSVIAVFKWQQKEAVLTNRPSPPLPRQGNDHQLALLAALEKERTKWKWLWEQTRARTPLGRSAVLCCAFPICLLSLASRSSAQETPRQRVYPSGSSTRMCFSSDCEVRLWIIPSTCLCCALSTKATVILTFRNVKNSHALEKVNHLIQDNPQNSD